MSVFEFKEVIGMPLHRANHGSLGWHRRVSRYADACVRNNGPEAYVRVHALAQRYPEDGDRRQFLDAVLAHLRIFEKQYGMDFDRPSGRGTPRR